MPTSVSFDATVDDLLVVADALPATAPRREWLRPAVFTALWLLAAWRAAVTGAGWALVIALLLAAPASAFLTWRLRKGTRRRALARMGRRSGALGPRALTITPGGLVATTRRGESLLPWQGLAARRLGGHLLVTEGTSVGIAVPLAAFGSEAACDAFVAALEAGRRAAATRLTPASR